MGEGAARRNDLEDSAASNADGVTENLELDTGAPVGRQIRVVKAEECSPGSIDPVKVEIGGPDKLVDARKYDVSCSSTRSKVVGRKDGLRLIVKSGGPGKTWR